AAHNTNRGVEPASNTGAQRQDESEQGGRITALDPMQIACFPKEAQDEFWADPGAIAAGSYAPVGKTVAVDGGYRTTGVWSFASGCDNAQWYLLSTLVPPAGGARKPKPRPLPAPRRACRT